MISTKKLLYKVVQALSVDYVTEEGVKTGGWYYRKWKSGKVECWSQYTSSGDIAGTAWTSPIYFTDITLAIPDGIFTSTPLRVYVASGNEQWWSSGIFQSSTSATQVKFRMCKPTSTAQPVKAFMYLVQVA